jgi:hypothetical protein
LERHATKLCYFSTLCQLGKNSAPLLSEDGQIAARTLGLVIGRHIDGGLHEDIEVTNHATPSDVVDFILRDPYSAGPLTRFRSL